MSNTPPAPKTIKEKLAAAALAFKSGENVQANLTALQGEHDIATAEITRLTEALAAANTLATERGSTIATHLETIKTLTTERDGFKTQADALPKKISDGVAEQMAVIGVPAAQLPRPQDGPPGANANEHAAKYRELQATDAGAAGAYFAKYREQILT
jgi:DNA-binding SARP family transcriptional activator